jgi:hypothetical protein
VAITNVTNQTAVVKLLSVSGLTAGNSYTYTWAGNCGAGSIRLHCGGGTTFGPAVMEVWSN